MPQAIPAILIAAGQAIVAGAVTAQILWGFIINVGLAGFEHVDEDGYRWVAVRRQRHE
jgi:hypothetical protein